MIVHEIDEPIERVHYWSDSTLTLQYINNTKHRLKVLVANAVSEILETSDPSQWTHIPGDINPADLLTRGVLDPEKLLSSRWFTAPEFLERDEDEWPRLDIKHLEDDGIAEIKQKPMCVGLNYVAVDNMIFDRVLLTKTTEYWKKL